ncbi:MAG: nitroreductase family protein [Clostridia bacterium]|nr:nitroreductase family protein [Clostridia bacterium]
MKDNSCKKVIENRKSTRFFLQKEVSYSDILDILSCAALAPSAKNKQPWRFYILNNDEKEKVVETFHKKLLKDNSEETGLETVRILKESNKVVIVFMDNKPIEAQKLRLTPYFLSVGASIENALLRATELGIQSLWIYDVVAIEDELKQMFYPEGMFMSALCFGYENGNHMRAKKKDLKDLILNKEE